MCHYFGVAKNFMLERGISRSSVENLLSHSAKKLRRGTFMFFRKLGHRKTLCLTGENRDSPGKIHCIKVLTNFVGEAFCDSKML